MVSKIEDEYVLDPCSPSPCGGNSTCSTLNGEVICRCLPGFVGEPPTCIKGCTCNNCCQDDEICIDSDCVKLCPGSCGTNAECTALTHEATCTCLPGYTGDPIFFGCVQLPKPGKKYI